MINEYDNKAKDVETGIPQGFPISFILFAIDISRVINKITEINCWIISPSFSDDFGFIALAAGLKRWYKITKTLLNYN